MAIVKETKGNNTLVTFSIGGHEIPYSSKILLLGDFKNWQGDNAYKMKTEDGSYVKSIKLENGKRYEFRYLSENNNWFNDFEADDYVPSPYYGVQNCVVDLTGIPVGGNIEVIENDDLKKIEGIGPKISAVLIENGIDTFEKLSTTRIFALENILKDAGLSKHHPSSWPKQAKFAFEDKWEDLKTLQDRLDGRK